MSRAVVYCDNT